MAKNESSNFCKNLSEIVSDAGYGAVTELAEHMGFHRVTMSKKIHGRDTLELAHAEKIAHFYGYSLSDLLVAPSKFRKKLATA